jgi:surface polysaccharide O-acyltransferase-like enzyme
VRALGALAVVLIHVGPFRGSEWEGTAAGLGGAFLNQLCRFAVPFFFLATGYFFGRKVGSGAAPLPMWRKQAGRLAVLFAFWSAAYLLVPAVLRGLNYRSLDAFGAFLADKLAWAANHPATSLLQGSAEHLWFLPALALGLAALAAAHALRVPPRAMAVVAVASYLVALLGGSYAPSPLGLDLGWDVRNGPFVAVPFVFLGDALSRRGTVAARSAALLAGAGLALSCVEALLLEHLYGSPLASHDNLVGTALMGPGVFLLSLAARGVEPGSLLPRLGALTLGVYAAHMLVALVLGKGLGAFSLSPVGRELLFPLVVWVGTLVLVAAAARSPRLRPVLA